MNFDLRTWPGLPMAARTRRCGLAAMLLGSALLPLAALAQSAGGAAPALTIVPDPPASPSSTSSSSIPALSVVSDSPLPAVSIAAPTSASAPFPVPSSSAPGGTLSPAPVAAFPSVTPAPKTVNAVKTSSPTPLPTGQPSEAGTASAIAKSTVTSTAPVTVPTASVPVAIPAAPMEAAKAMPPPSSMTAPGAISNVPAPIAASTPPSQIVAPVANPAMPPALTPDASAVNMTKPASAVGASSGLDLTPAGAASGVANSPVKPSVATPAGPDDYFDAGGASSPLLSGQGPRKVSPVKEPGQRFVVAEKNEGEQSRDAQLVAGQRALAAGEYGAAAEIYDALYLKYPRDQNVLMGRAVAHQHAGDSRQAAEMYDDMLEEDPRNVDAQVNILGIMSKEYPDVALHKLESLRGKHPADPLIVAQMGVTAGQIGDYDSAIRFLQAASNLEPGNAQHMFNLAVVEDKAGHSQDAVRDYQEALETDGAHGGTPTIPRDKIQARLLALRGN